PLSLLPASAQSQTSSTEAPWARLQWSSSAAASRYSEPNLGVKIAGPELGLHLRLSDLRGLPRLQLEADGLLGAQDYSSRDGQLSDRRTLDLRARGLYQLMPTTAERGLYAGLAIQSSYSDLRGTVRPGSSSTRAVEGYERLNQSVWLALQWRDSLNWDVLPKVQGYQLDLGHLLDGRQRSYLSQVGGAWRDTTNKQSSGWYLQLQGSWVAERGLTLEPFLRYTQVSGSDTVDAGGGRVTEPPNNRWQFGLKATWPPH
ncbi:MAG: hypothetical protein WCK08_20335, partial [Betaproteobacteria bacterium]